MSCKANFEMAQSAKQKRIGSVEEFVSAALSHLKPLVETRFFVVYPILEGSYRQFRTEFAFYLDAEYKYIEVAANDYFSKLYNDSPECPTLEIKCVQKARSGVQVSPNNCNVNVAFITIF